ncbi:conserved hypothetical protein [Hahella chejuensis KCTC 2396]|uniref:DUF4261 domain-containing protein n=1 Tax=Hahella chejuensis (strain KCTC 2396) TaxID=349521 RepID=Q2SPA6_HAHCH|nr:DUF4261 domain-containing protein [Hahella chejuensis]ABC27518.1 conserved hypothetical protein [Hahella chejuensis KCTC 2396]
MNNQTANQNPAFPGAIQMMLLASPFTLSVTELEAYLREELDNQSVTVQGSENAEDGYVITWGGMAFAVMVIDKPIPADTFNVALRTSHRLKNGEQLIKDHKAHLIISPLNTTDDQLRAIYSALRVMTIADLLAQRAKPLAFYWSNSEVLADNEQFAQAVRVAGEAMEKFNSDVPNALYGLPTTYLAGIRILSSKDKNMFGAITKGLDALTGFEIQIDPFQCKPSEVAKHLYSMVGYILANGPVFSEGNTIGIERDKQFRMRKIPANDVLPARWAMNVETIN